MKALEVGRREVARVCEGKVGEGSTRLDSTGFALPYRFILVRRFGFGGSDESSQRFFFIEGDWVLNGQFNGTLNRYYGYWIPSAGYQVPGTRFPSMSVGGVLRRLKLRGVWHVRWRSIC